MNKCAKEPKPEIVTEFNRFCAQHGVSAWAMFARAAATTDETAVPVSVMAIFSCGENRDLAARAEFSTIKDRLAENAEDFLKDVADEDPWLVVAEDSWLVFDPDITMEPADSAAP